MSLFDAFYSIFLPQNFSFNSFILSTSLFTRSLTIQTPKQLEELKQGQYDQYYHTIFIKPEAHPKILSEAKQLANSTFKEINLTDQNGNTIILYPRTQYALARFNVGEGLYFTLPPNYVNYFIDSGNKVGVTIAELDYIMQWKNTIFLDIRDRSNVANELVYRVEQMKVMKRLRTLTLRVQRDSYELFDVKPFLEQLPSLRSVTIIADTLNKTELKEFLDKHGQFNHWTRSIPLLMRQLVYERAFNKKKSIDLNGPPEIWNLFSTLALLL